MPDLRVKKWLEGFIRPASTCLVLSTGLGLGAGILLIIQASVLAWTVHHVIFDDHGLVDVLPGLWLILGLIVCRTGLIWCSRYFSGLAAVKVKQTIRETLFRKLHSLDPVNTSLKSSGEMVNLMVDGVESLDGYFSGYLPQLALAAMIPPAILFFIFPLDWVSGLILLLTAPFIPFFMIVIGRKAESLNQAQWERINRLSHRFLDAIQGLTTLKMFNAGKREAKVVEQVSSEYAQSTLSVLKVAFLSSLVLEFMATVSVAVVAVIIGFRLLWGDMLFGSAFFILILAPEFYLPLRNLGTHFHSKMSAVSAAEKVVDFLDLPEHSPGSGTITAGFGSVEIEFDRVSYAYPGGQKIISNLSFQAPGPGLTCLIGTSGHGKTTSLRLILGLLKPDSGKVLVNRMDLHSLDQASWLKHVAFLPQKPHLLSRSIADNIRTGRGAAPLEQVRDAAVKARVHREIDSLPQGYETIAGEDGAHLSGGQRQRVALARTFIRDAPLVLLDEPGAGLDKKVRDMIYESILEMARTKCVIMVAHDEEILPRARNIVRIT
ncbi:thiol reductant ABC exporter subunit CydD [Desulfonatronovibrio hydrogenovorans]|uniref:thiol reductant ABC exporter subunit CydD n=1 Tax=Desulfonatronovibrio hydrogenovorans TaxID=53245 RepID=UPI00068A2DDC|nr:thiol reductant ABC exporter subunit CydD [Desulfonatronovibrio hydrogenovorans]